MNEIWTIAKQLIDLGFQSVFTAFIFYFWFNYINTKFFDDKNIIKMREINNKIDERENINSKRKINNLQSYLQNKSGEIFSMWIDRVSIWLNHNWLRSWKIHFLYYSLVSEIVRPWVQSLLNNCFSTNKVPYYVFAEFENNICEKWFILKHSEELETTWFCVTKDIWTKTIYGLPIIGLNGKIDWIIFFWGVANKIENIPNVDNIVWDVRAILVDKL